MVDALKHEREDADIWICPEQWDAVRLFQACATQWRYAGATGEIIGLDYAGVGVVISRLHFPDEAFAGLQVMESEALRYWSGEREKRARRGG